MDPLAGLLVMGSNLKEEEVVISYIDNLDPNYPLMKK